MIAADKVQMLKAFLGNLPESAALKLAKAVEVDRLADGKLLPHDLILEGLRPVLRHADASGRTPTPLRLFCQPFTDLLVLETPKQKLKGRIARASLIPVWNWLGRTLIPHEHATYCATVKSASLAWRIRDAQTVVEEFWPGAAAAIRKALADEKGRKAARIALNGDVTMNDALEMAYLLAAGREIAELQDLVPKHTPVLTEELLWSMRAIYDRLVASAPDSAPYVAVVAMHRFARPWEAMRLPLTIARQTQDTLISNTDMGLVGEILLGDMEAHAAQIRNVRQPQFDAAELVGHVADFTLLSNGIVKEVEMRRDGRWGQRLMKDRAGVAEVLDGFMKRAPKEILAALPTLKTGSYAGGPRAPDLSRPLDPEKVARAQRYAQLVIGCKSLAAAASIGATLADACDEVMVSLRAYCEDIVRELRAAEGARRPLVEAYFELAAELTTMFFSAEEGEFLRRRGRAATASAAAA